MTSEKRHKKLACYSSIYMMTVVNFSSIRNVIEWPPSVVHNGKTLMVLEGDFDPKVRLTVSVQNMLIRTRNNDSFFFILPRSILQHPLLADMHCLGRLDAGAPGWSLLYQSHEPTCSILRHFRLSSTLSSIPVLNLKISAWAFRRLLASSN